MPVIDTFHDEETLTLTIVAEFAPPKRKGLYTSLGLSTPPAGIALATAAIWRRPRSTAPPSRALRTSAPSCRC